MKAGEYMKVSEGQFAMKGGVSDTLFGLIGSTTGQTHQKTLGGLISHSPNGKIPTDLKKGKVAMATEKHIGGKNATMSAHMGQVPYPGKFLTTKGAKL
jgi:hypothetical protein